MVDTWGHLQLCSLLSHFPFPCSWIGNPAGMLQLCIPKEEGQSKDSAGGRNVIRVAVVAAWSFPGVHFQVITMIPRLYLGNSGTYLLGQK